MSDKQNSSTDRRTALAGDDHAGWRLDRFLAASLPDFSRSRLQQLLEGAAVSLGAQDQPQVTIKDANHRVKPGETYTVIVPPTGVKQPTWPAVGPAGHGAVARAVLPGSQVTWSLVKVWFALRATPGRHWNTVLTRTSAHGFPGRTV